MGKRSEWIDVSVPTLDVGIMGMFSWLFLILMFTESYIVVAGEDEIFHVKYNQTLKAHVVVRSPRAGSEDKQTGLSSW